VRLTNCQIGAKSKYGDDDSDMYFVVPVRSKNSSAAMQYDAINNRLLGMDLPPPCAATAALAYTKTPASYLGVLTRRAFAGDPAATKELQSAPSWCDQGRDGPPGR
jgi:hypothetical protein